MRTQSIVKTINTACGKTVTYLQTDGYPNKMHSTEGPAIVYAEEEGKSPEYYLYGIMYTKAEWKERVAQQKTPDIADALFDTDYGAIY